MQDNNLEQFCYLLIVMTKFKGEHIFQSHHYLHVTFHNCITDKQF